MTLGPWVEDWLSVPRFGRYLSECGGNRQRALEMYEWNLQLGHALLRDVAHFEVALRNAYDREMCSRWTMPKHWLLDTTSPVRQPLLRRVHGHSIDVNQRNRVAIDDALRLLGASASPDRIVAELSFGFWTHMTDAMHEQSVWIPYLRHVWPRGTARGRISQQIARINTARNRAAHYEPLFEIAGDDKFVLHIRDDVIALITSLSSDLADYVERTSSVAHVLNQRP